jgi:IS5 family transposase
MSIRASRTLPAGPITLPLASSTAVARSRAINGSFSTINTETWFSNASLPRETSLPWPVFANNLRWHRSNLSARETFHRYRNKGRKPLGLPDVVDLTAKLTNDAAADEDATKSLADGRLFNTRPVTLFPPQQQIVGFNLPGDMNQPLTDAQRAILRGVERFGQHLEAEGYIARGGQIIDATIVSVPKQRNTKEEIAQKDKDARWTKKNDASFYGYKNHLGVDKAHKLIRKWDATDAAVHDSQKLDDVLDLSNTGKGVWADSTYRSVQIEAGLKEKGLQSRIHRRAARDRPLSERQKSANTTRSKVRARVEHVFGQQQSSMGGKIVRTIGIARARFKIGMMNLGYNIRRLVQLERMAAAPA